MFLHTRSTFKITHFFMPAKAAQEKEKGKRSNSQQQFQHMTNPNKKCIRPFWTK